MPESNNNILVTGAAGYIGSHVVEQLVKNKDKKVTHLNPATKNNLKNYLAYYRILTDAVNIKDAYIVNIAINFDIVVLPDYNSNEVLLRCIQALKDYFNINNWKIFLYFIFV